jgi:hypothetical protein
MHTHMHIYVDIYSFNSHNLLNKHIIADAAHNVWTYEVSDYSLY